MNINNPNKLQEDILREERLHDQAKQELRSGHLFRAAGDELKSTGAATNVTMDEFRQGSSNVPSQSQFQQQQQPQFQQQSRQPLIQQQQQQPYLQQPNLQQPYLQRPNPQQPYLQQPNPEQPSAEQPELQQWFPSQRNKGASGFQ